MKYGKLLELFVENIQPFNSILPAELFRVTLMLEQIILLVTIVYEADCNCAWLLDFQPRFLAPSHL